MLPCIHEERFYCLALVCDPNSSIIFSSLILHSAETWTFPETTGEAPPALYNHALTYIGHDRAVLTGGNEDESACHNGAFLLDMKTWVRTSQT